MGLNVTSNKYVNWHPGFQSGKLEEPIAELAESFRQRHFRDQIMPPTPFPALTIPADTVQKAITTGAKQHDVQDEARDQAGRWTRSGTAASHGPLLTADDVFDAHDALPNGPAGVLDSANLRSAVGAANGGAITAGGRVLRKLTPLQLAALSNHYIEQQHGPTAAKLDLAQVALKAPAPPAQPPAQPPAPAAPSAPPIAPTAPPPPAAAPANSAGLNWVRVNHTTVGAQSPNGHNLLVRRNAHAGTYGVLVNNVQRGPTFQGVGAGKAAQAWAEYHVSTFPAHPAPGAPPVAPSPAPVTPAASPASPAYTPPAGLNWTTQGTHDTAPSARNGGDWTVSQVGAGQWEAFLDDGVSVTPRYVVDLQGNRRTFPSVTSAMTACTMLERRMSPSFALAPAQGAPAAAPRPTRKKDPAASPPAAAAAPATNSPPLTIPAVSPPTGASGAAVRWPATVAGLRKGAALTGSTPGWEATDPATGEKFAVKTGNSGPHAKNELSANDAYSAAGVRALPVREYTENGQTYQVSPWIPVAAPILSAPAGSPAVREFAQGMAADALLANWDIIRNDNAQVDAQGHPIRMDNGGAFSFTAQGKQKNAQYGAGTWDAYPDELWTLRDPNGKAGAGAHLYDSLTFLDVVDQMDALTQRGAALLAAVRDPGDRKVVSDRLSVMAHLVTFARVKIAAGVGHVAADRSTQLEMNRLRRAGIVP